MRFETKQVVLRDPLEVFFELRAPQKAFIKARVRARTDAEAAREAGINSTSVAEWKNRDEKFRLCYEAFCTSLLENVVQLMGNRLVLTANSALNVWERYLGEEEPSRQKTEQARLAKDFIVEVSKKMRTMDEPNLRAVREVEVFDVDELTREALEESKRLVGAVEEVDA